MGKGREDLAQRADPSESFWRKKKKKVFGEKKKESFWKAILTQKPSVCPSCPLLEHCITANLIIYCNCHLFH